MKIKVELNDLIINLVGTPLQTYGDLIEIIIKRCENQLQQLECHYIGDWDSKVKCINVIQQLLYNKLLNKTNEFLNFDVDGIINIITKVVKNDTRNITTDLNVGDEESPINADLTYAMVNPSYKSHTKGTENNVNVIDYNDPKYDMEMLKIRKTYKSMYTIVFESLLSLIDEYTESY